MKRIGKEIILQIPRMKVIAVPRLFKTVFKAVAVVRWPAGNHNAESTGGAPNVIGPAKPFNSCPILLVL